MSTGIEGADPPITSPTPKRARPMANGRTRPPRSIAWPATTMPTSVPRKKALKAHP